jgi:flagellar motor switch protein FliN/FliY
VTAVDTISAEAIEAAAQAVAESFGLGDSTIASSVWPVDDGDTVFAAEIGGDVPSVMLLAVNDDVAARLASDPSRMATGFQLALDAVAEATGMTFELGEIAQAEDTAPRSTIEIQDGTEVCALFAFTVLDTSTSDGDAVDGLDAGAAGGAAGGPGAEPIGETFTPAAFGADGSSLATPSSGPLSLLHDVEMDVTVELGRTSMPIRELLSLQPGMVVEIDRPAGAPIDVLVNGRLIACGEVVVIDEEFGIRITEIVASGSPTDG